MNKKGNENVSIIIPYCFGDIKDTILGLSNQEYPGKRELLIIYDNPKTPLEKSKRKFLKDNGAKIIANKQNLGLAGSYNKGIKSATYENIIIMHEDCVPTSNQLIVNLLKELNKHPGSVVDANITYSLQVWSKYDYWNKILVFRYLKSFGPSLGKTSSFKKSLFKKTGYFDNETFKTAGEDLDFVYRMKLLGIKSLATKDIVYHNHFDKNASLKKVLKKEWQMGEAHGAWKRKYKLKRMGKFDVEVRLLSLFFMILGLFTYKVLFFIGLLPFIVISIFKSIKNYNASKWLPGLITFPFICLLILFVQIIANLKGLIVGKQGQPFFSAQQHL